MSQPPWAQDAYIKAYRFAAQAHIGQLFPGTQISYLMHLSLVCMEVMAALRAEPGRDEALAVQCALLHDVIEDTQTSCEQVLAEFGPAVAQGVLALSKDKTLDRSLQMDDSLARIRQQPQEVWMVKLADRITNLQAPPPDWTREKMAAYKIEALKIFDVLGEASSFLAARLREKIAAYG